MSREILFRGKRVDNNQWTEGFLSFVYTDGKNSNGFIYTDKAQIYSPVEVRVHDVYTATVGQYTGLCDKNGVTKIFEGDIVTYPDGDGGYEYCDETINSGVVTWDDESALFYITNNYSAEFPDMWDRVDEMEVIGNIHDNEELLKEESE